MKRKQLPLGIGLAVVYGIVSLAAGQTTPSSPTSSMGTGSGVARDALTNDDVVMMVQNRLNDKIILTSIDNAPATAFDATPSGLLALKAGGVKDKIISEIQRIAAEKQAPSLNRFVMTNDQVLLMVSGKVRLSEEIVIAAIQNAREKAFDISPKGLIDLKTGGLNDTVIRLIQDQSAPKAAATAAPTVGETVPNPLYVAPGARDSASSGFATGPASSAAPKANTPGTSGGSAALSAPSANGPAAHAPGTGAVPTEASGRSAKAPVALGKVPTDSGIYLYSDDGKGPAFLLLEPTVYTATKTGGAFKTAMTYGIAKMSVKASVRGAQASIGTSDSSAEFYFVFENKQTQLGASSPWGGASSPNEFSLIRFDVKSSTREVIVGQANAYGAQSGTQDKANVEFTSTRLAPGTYHVVPKAPLADGQYAFIVGGSATAATLGNRLFDFGIAR
jgi:hypothetical protein